MSTKYLLALLPLLVVAMPAGAQIVQLPTYRVFSTTTTVVVPDRGTAYLGGIGRSAYGRSSRGLPLASRLPAVGRLGRSSSRSATSSHASVHVTATIIDHNELDRLVLSRAGAPRAAVPSDSETERIAAFLSKHVARHDHQRLDRQGMAAAPLDQRRHHPHRRPTMPDSKARQLLERGQRLEREGRASVAKLFYHNVSQQSVGAVKQSALRHLHCLESAATPVQMAGR